MLILYGQPGKPNFRAVRLPDSSPASLSAGMSWVANCRRNDKTANVRHTILSELSARMLMLKVGEKIFNPDNVPALVAQLDRATEF